MKVVELSYCLLSMVVNNNVAFSLITSSTKSMGSRILVLFIGGIGKLYLQCEFFFFDNFSDGNVDSSLQGLDQGCLCYMLCICPINFQSLSCYFFHIWEHFISITNHVHVHFLYFEILLQNRSPIFFQKCFIMT